MHDITDATESARAILLGLNREWINKQGDFFVKSPINFLTAVIWFLRNYDTGKYCTLPHVIELMQADYDKLFPILNTEPEIESTFKGRAPFDRDKTIKWKIVSKKGGPFKVLPKRWIVERSFVWLTNFRRLGKDYEKNIECSKAMILMAAIVITLHKLLT